jgi:hypothetical protein
VSALEQFFERPVVVGSVRSATSASGNSNSKYWGLADRLLRRKLDDRIGQILLKNSKPCFSGVCRNLPGGEIVEYRAIVNVDLLGPTSLFARKRVFQQHRHIALIHGQPEILAKIEIIRPAPRPDP